MINYSVNSYWYIGCITYVVILALSFIAPIESLHFDGTWRQVGSDIVGKSARDRFGSSVAISADGKTIVIGAPTRTESGYVRVYSISSTTGNWQQIGSDINGKAAGDMFGFSVCISEDGNTFAAGAVGNDENGFQSGQVLVYSFNSISGMWEQFGSAINGEVNGDNSGRAVDLSADGKTIAIGANGIANANGIFSGQVRVFLYNSTSRNWTQLGLDIDGEAAYDKYGYSVAMSSDGKTMVSGAIFHDNINAGYAETGQVRIFSKINTSSNWTQVGSELKGRAPAVNFGYSVAISSNGKTIAVGAPTDNVFKNNANGYVHVYSINATSGDWTQVGLDIDGETAGEQSGYSVALSHDGLTLAIGGKHFDTSNSTDPEHVRVYKYELHVSSTNAPIMSFTKSPTGSPTKQPTASPIKAPTTRPTRNPTLRPASSPTKSPTKRPTKFPTNNPTKASTKSPTTTPINRPTKSNSPTKSPTTNPTKNPTKAPSQITLPVPIPIMVPIQVPLSTPVVAPTNCGLFGFNFFCPRRGECGFWRRLLNLRGC